MFIGHQYASVLNCLCSFPFIYGELNVFIMSSFLIKDITLCPVGSKIFPLVNLPVKQFLREIVICV